MSELKYNLVSVGDESNLTLFLNGEMYVASDQHPNWTKIVAGALSGDIDVDLFDVAKAVEKRFETLSSRASISNGELYFDGDVMHTALAGEVIRFLDEGEDDWKPLVAFLEKVMQNPQEHSRNQLFEWLERNEFTITDDGDIVGYKSVLKTDEDVFTSVHEGTATVNGVEFTGRIPQAVGDVVEMPRGSVAFDPSQGCSTGLHVANWKYASTWTTHAAVFAVSVNPRDVVSVPTDSDFQKVRVCRYKVIDIVEHVKDAAVWPTTASYPDCVTWDDDDDEEDEYCTECDEYVDDCTCDEDDEAAQEEADNATALRVKDAAAAAKANMTPNPWSGYKAATTYDNGGNNRFW
jgi:hypothetical protein